MGIEVKQKAKLKPLKAWSFSRLNTYEQCPFKFKLTAIEGIREPGSPAMERGSLIHKEGEQYIKGILDELPESYKLLANAMNEVKEQGAEAELEMTFRKDWGVTGWFDADAWVRIKIDILLVSDDTIRIIDIKTGKNRGGYEDQLDLYALAALNLYPEIKNVSAELWFTDTGEIIATSKGMYTAAMLPDLKKKWEKRVVPMFEDTIYPARPNKFCGFCHFRKANNGPCEY